VEIKEKLSHVETPEQKPVPLSQFKIINGKLYTTCVTADTKADSMTNEDLLQEMKKRDLIKDDDSYTSAKIELQNGTTANVGLAKNKVKLTSAGVAYREKIKQADDNPRFISTSLESPNLKFIIIVPPPAGDNLFIEIGLNKHLLVVCNLETKEYFAFSYLTGSKQGELVSTKLFKTFQLEQDSGDTKKGIENSLKGKLQHIAKLRQPVLIKEEDIKRVKWDTEYLDSININIIKGLWEDIKNNPIADFDEMSITLQDGLDMCKACDNTYKTKGKHPKTEDQIEKENEAKLKQKEQQEKAKLDKYTNTLKNEKD